MAVILKFKMAVIPRQDFQVTNLITSTTMASVEPLVVEPPITDIGVSTSFILQGSSEVEIYYRNIIDGGHFEIQYGRCHTK